MTHQNFEPDFNNLEQVLSNRRPKRLPIYEHHIDAPFISEFLGEEICPENLNLSELRGYYKKVIEF